jgi:DNA repair/transcription protein MET18/MMS19
LIKAIPKAAYAHEMPSVRYRKADLRSCNECTTHQLMPLLLRGLELPDFNIRADVIDTFLSAAEGDASEQSLVSEHSSTLVTYMLKNSMVNEMPSVVRCNPSSIFRELNPLSE